MTADRLRKFFVIAFVVIFFSYLFGPLILMSVSAFNSSAFPRVMPWECFSVEWFDVLIQDDKLMLGLRTSGGVPSQWCLCGEDVLRDLEKDGLIERLPATDTASQLPSRTSPAQY